MGGCIGGMKKEQTCGMGRTELNGQNGEGVVFAVCEF